MELLHCLLTLGNGVSVQVSSFKISIFESYCHMLYISQNPQNIKICFWWITFLSFLLCTNFCCYRKRDNLSYITKTKGNQKFNFSCFTNCSIYCMFLVLLEAAYNWVDRWLNPSLAFEAVKTNNISNNSMHNVGYYMWGTMAVFVIPM